MAKMWAGRTDGVTEKIADDFNSSIHFDSRMYRQDIKGRMWDMAFIADLMPDYLIFFNGACSGASAPDHMHFHHHKEFHRFPLMHHIM